MGRRLIFVRVTYASALLLIWSLHMCEYIGGFAWCMINGQWNKRSGSEAGIAKCDTGVVLCVRGLNSEIGVWVIEGRGSLKQDPIFSEINA